MIEYTFDAVVIGAGGGGFGAAYQLAQNGIRTAVVDKNRGFGGTAVYAGVSCWEPGVSCHRVLSLLAEKTERIQMGGGVGFDVPNSNLFAMNELGHLDEDWSHHDAGLIPSGVSAVRSGTPYERCCWRCKRLSRAGRPARYHFEGGAMAQAMEELMSPCSENITSFWNSEFLSCTLSNGAIAAVYVKTKDGLVSLKAKEFIDASGDIVLARAAGCECITGSESNETYHEPSAGERDADAVNGVTRIFRLTKSNDNCAQDNLPGSLPDVCEWKENVLYKNKVSAVYNIYPNGDINVNMLPTMDGNEYFRLGESAGKICTARAAAYFEYVKNTLGALKEYRLQKFFPMMGIRESYRLVGQTVLSENDIRAGFTDQRNRDEIIAYSDHALDGHGKNHLNCELELPYGVPYSCMLPKEIKNLHVACRGASFSRLAASSCRLTRVMIVMGLAAGEAVSQRILQGRADVLKIRMRLGLDEYERFLKEQISEK